MLSIAMLMLAQEIIGPPGDEPPPAAVTRQRHCAPGADEILVCGTPDSPRLAPLPERGTQRVFGPAEARLSPNKTVSATAQQSSSPFAEGPRAMINFRLDF